MGLLGFFAHQLLQMDNVVAKMILNRLTLSNIKGFPITDFVVVRSIDNAIVSGPDTSLGSQGLQFGLFGLVSLFNGISTFIGYLIPKSSL